MYKHLRSCPYSRESSISDMERPPARCVQSNRFGSMLTSLSPQYFDESNVNVPDVNFFEWCVQVIPLGKRGNNWALSTNQKECRCSSLAEWKNRPCKSQFHLTRNKLNNFGWEVYRVSRCFSWRGSWTKVTRTQPKGLAFQPNKESGDGSIGMWSAQRDGRKSPKCWGTRVGEWWISQSKGTAASRNTRPLMLYISFSFWHYFLSGGNKSFVVISRPADRKKTPSPQEPTLTKQWGLGECFVILKTNFIVFVIEISRRPRAVGAERRTVK